MCAQQLIDNETAAREANREGHVSCGPSCNACCEHGVVVTAAESRAISAAIAELPAATQDAITNRARQVLDRVDAELPNDPTSLESFTADFMQAYYALGEPCPLLIDGSCSVRAVRPLVCRNYLMSSEPERCFDPTLDRVIRIRTRRDVAAGFRDVSERFDDPDPSLLLIALLKPAAAATPRSVSGPRLARLLTNAR